MKCWWGIRIVRAAILKAAIPGATDTSRVRSIFESDDTTDQFVARDIRSDTAKGIPPTNDDPISIAIADPSLVLRALNTLLNNLTFDHDHS